mmetsp:Transcript_17292/g.34406  ORF Transcript_17292/g.34406 Transcript_17292/m.34406 type:complete len:288 (+) Transcript_17292:295-1158(+)
MSPNGLTGCSTNSATTPTALSCSVARSLPSSTAAFSPRSAFSISSGCGEYPDAALRETSAPALTFPSRSAMFFLSFLVISRWDAILTYHFFLSSVRSSSSMCPMQPGDKSRSRCRQSAAATLTFKLSAMPTRGRYTRASAPESISSEHPTLSLPNTTASRQGRRPPSGSASPPIPAVRIPVRVRGTASWLRSVAHTVRPSDRSALRHSCEFENSLTDSHSAAFRAYRKWEREAEASDGLEWRRRWPFETPAASSSSSSPVGAAEGIPSAPEAEARRRRPREREDPRA